MSESTFTTNSNGNNNEGEEEEKRHKTGEAFQHKDSNRNDCNTTNVDSSIPSTSRSMNDLKNNSTISNVSYSTCSSSNNHKSSPNNQRQLYIREIVDCDDVKYDKQHADVNNSNNSYTNTTGPNHTFTPLTEDYRERTRMLVDTDSQFISTLIDVDTSTNTTTTDEEESSITALPKRERMNCKPTIQSFDDETRPPSSPESRNARHHSTERNQISNNNKTTTIHLTTRNLVDAILKESIDGDNDIVDDTSNHAVLVDDSQNPHTTATIIATTDMVVQNVQVMVVPSLTVVMDARPVYSVLVEEEQIHHHLEDCNTDINYTSTLHPQVPGLIPEQKQQEQDQVAPLSRVQSILLLWKKSSFKIKLRIAGITILASACILIAINFLTPRSRSRSISKEEAFISFINTYTLLGRNITINGSTPEDAALGWMIDSDPVFITTQSWQSIIPTKKGYPTYPETAEQFRFLQRYALLTIRFQVTKSTIATLEERKQLPPEWHDLYGWTDTNECSWYGIKCDDVQPEEGDVGTQHDVVTVIDFNIESSKRSSITSNITGTISADLGLLSHLRYFDVSLCNLLQGSLPSTIGRWTSIQYFNVNNNALSGTIPSTIGERWTALTYFNVSNNALSGTLPSTIGEGWTALTYVNVNNNALSGTLPSTIGEGWTALTYFNIQNNTFSGTLPSTIGERWTAITYFNVADNRMNGTIPSTIEKFFHRLEHVYLYGNEFIGTISDTICDSITNRTTNFVIDCIYQK